MYIIKHKNITHNTKFLIKLFKTDFIGGTGGLFLYPSLYYITDLKLFLVQTFFCVGTHIINCHFIKKQLRVSIKNDYKEYENYKYYNITINGDIILRNDYTLGGTSLHKNMNNSSLIHKMINQIQQKNNQLVINYLDMDNQIQNYINVIIQSRKNRARHYITSILLLPICINYIFDQDTISYTLACIFTSNFTYYHMHYSYYSKLYNNITHHVISKYPTILNAHLYNYIYIDIIGNICFQEKRRWFNFRKNIKL